MLCPGRIGFQAAIGYICFVDNKKGLLIDIGLYGCLLPIAGVAIVVILQAASSWFYDEDIWILGWLFRFIGGTIGVALAVFYIAWLWKTFKRIVFGSKEEGNEG